MKLPKGIRKIPGSSRGTFVVSQSPHVQSFWWGQRMMQLPMPYMHYQMHHNSSQKFCQLGKIFMTKAPLVNYQPDTKIFPAVLPNLDMIGNVCMLGNREYYQGDRKLESAFTLIQKFWSGGSNGDYQYFRRRIPWKEIAETNNLRISSHVVYVLRAWERIPLEDIMNISWTKGSVRESELPPHWTSGYHTTPLKRKAIISS